MCLFLLIPQPCHLRGQQGCPYFSEGARAQIDKATCHGRPAEAQIPTSLLCLLRSQTPKMMYEVFPYESNSLSPLKDRWKTSPLPDPTPNPSQQNFPECTWLLLLDPGEGPLSKGTAPTIWLAQEFLVKKNEFPQNPKLAFPATRWNKLVSNWTHFPLLFLESKLTFLVPQFFTDFQKI